MSKQKQLKNQLNLAGKSKANKQKINNLTKNNTDN